MEENKQVETNNNKKKGLETKYIVLIAAGALIVGGGLAFLVFSIFNNTLNAGKGLFNRTLEKVEEYGDDYIKDDAEKAYDIIKSKIGEELEDDKTSSFNDDLEFYAGTKKGSSVRLLLDEVILKMKKEKDHQLTVKHNATIATDPDTVLTIKKELDLTKDYEVVTDYDTEGFINAITILDY